MLEIHGGLPSQALHLMLRNISLLREIALSRRRSRHQALLVVRCAAKQSGPGESKVLDGQGGRPSWATTKRSLVPDGTSCTHRASSTYAALEQQIRPQFPFARVFFTMN